MVPPTARRYRDFLLTPSRFVSCSWSTLIRKRPIVPVSLLFILGAEPAPSRAHSQTLLPSGALKSGQFQSSPGLGGVETLSFFISRRRWPTFPALECAAGFLCSSFFCLFERLAASFFLLGPRQVPCFALCLARRTVLLSLAPLLSDHSLQ